ncbi:Family of unknown function [Salegentibacter echinorum]|uniref:Translocation and assembly module TamB C-terminal domain-containing protein n=1 Tax=Salegentibacter echinorum TaxID=1073325 RepID=A0A1M5CK43_SALEC|nr:translocation/assembly module TamB domain-containing protein [Salegentibacter echinorum]SHF55071.1 Family of unknown function [Salegentibacter echinorum]
MEEKKEKEKKKSKKGTRILKIIAKIFAGLFILILLILLFIRSPWGQDIIKEQVVKNISGKTNTEISLDRLFITFAGNIQIDGLYLEDKKGDTLVYSKMLEADIPIWPIIQGGAISVDQLDWEGLKANVIRKDSVNGFNYEFLMEAFASDSTQTPQDTTSSQPMEINIGEVNFKDFDLKFKDDVLGIDAKLNLGELGVAMDKTSLPEMDFRVEEAVLNNTQVTYFQSKPFPPSEEEEEPAPSPYLVINSFKINDVSVNYQSIPDGLNAQIGIKDFLAEIPLVDLKKQEVEVGRIALSKSAVAVNMNSAKDSIANTAENKENLAAKDEEEVETGFSWPEWRVDVKEISLEENRIAYSRDSIMPKSGVFDANAIFLEDFNFKAEDLVLQEKSAEAKIAALNFQEASGINLKKFNFSLNLSDENLEVSNLDLALNENELQGQTKISYNSLEDFIENYENASLAIDWPKFNLDLKDIFLFQPDLKKNTYLKEISKNKISGALKADGKLTALTIPTAKFNWKNTNITARGKVFNATDPDNIRFDFPRFVLNSNKADLATFVDEKKMGVDIPKQINLTGNFSGTPEDLKAQANLNTTDGGIKLDASFQNTEDIAFNAEMETESVQLGKILKNPQLGALNLRLTANGQGSNLNVLDAKFNITIDSFAYNEYKIRDLAVLGDIENGRGTVTSDYKDENIDLALNSNVVLDSVSPEADLNLDLKGIKLQAFGIASRDIRMAFNLDAGFKGNADEFKANANFTENTVVFDEDTYLPGDLSVNAFVRPDTTAVSVSNKIISLDLESNANPTDFSNALFRHYRSYISEEVKTDTVANPVNLKLRGKLADAPVLHEVFLPGLKQLDTVNITADFREKERILKAGVSLPFINYADSEIDSLGITVDTDKDNFDFNLGFNAINSGPIAIHKTDFNGRLGNKKIFLNFTSMQDEEHLFHVNSEVSQVGDSLRFHLQPEELILNKNEWDIAANNELLILDKSITARDFRLHRNNQEMIISSDLAISEKKHLGLRFNNFNLASFLAYFNPDEKLASGDLNGDIAFEDPMGKFGILAGLEINQLKMMDVDLGTLSLDATPRGGFNYDVGLALKGENADLDLEGSLVAKDSTTAISMNLDINEFKMKAVEAFSLGTIKDGTGSFSGNMSLEGSTTEPQYKGEFNFNEAGFKLTLLDAQFTLPSEKLRLDNEGIYFDNFRVEDVDNNAFTVNGEVLTEDFLNPEFDLQFKANNFQVLNSDEEDNELFYGTASFDADAQLTGDLNMPKLNLDLTIGPDTDFTYVLPKEEMAIEERGGVVIFVNRENPDNILTQTDEEESATLSGYDIKARIRVDKSAVFNIILDPQTGDNLQVKGEGDLDLAITPNGRMNLSGRYTLSDGHYEMSLYNLVKRRFDIAEGSRVSWAGDPFDASLDVSAIYKVDASPASIMGDRNGNPNEFRRDLPFLVYLNVDGELLKPKLSFGLRMPEDSQGASGGQVYSRIQQLNNQESELNKQVFSLLVLNRFYPTAGSDGSSGGTMTIARDNLNQALSDQLNIFSDKLLGDTGVELNFGVDSYTDASAEERTEVDISAQKKLFNDRIIVSVGSQVDVQGSDRGNEEGPNPIIGDVSVQYLINKGGQFRLKGFRENKFANVIDGQIIISGIAFIFNREFNEFQELWDNFFLKQRDEDEENNEKE